MKKYIKIFVIILAIVSLASIVFPVIPPHSWYSKYILTNSSVLSELGLDKNQCRYQEAQMLIEAHPAYISCFTTNRYQNTSDAQTEAIGKMRSILEKNGWTFSSKDSLKTRDITYSKGLRKIRIYPYDWEKDYNHEGAELKLIVSLQ